MADPAPAALISMCERALAGEISLDELDELWPLPVESDALVPFREALEDGIEHTSGYRTRPGLNLTAWQRMPEFSDIEFYLGRLREDQA